MISFDNLQEKHIWIGFWIKFLYFMQNLVGFIRKSTFYILLIELLEGVFACLSHLNGTYR